MENIKTISAIVSAGKVILDFPELMDGTEIIFQILSTGGVEINPEINDVSEFQSEKVQVKKEKKNVEDKGTTGDKEITGNEKTIGDKESKKTEGGSVSDRITTDSSFGDLQLEDDLVRAVEKIGYKHPSLVQEQSIPIALQGKDLIATAQTGSGKTAAFSLPMIQRIRAKPRGKIRGLVLAPTRELAIQIDTSLLDYAKFSKIRHTKIYGGVSQNPQVKAVKKGVDILVATPGRLLDLISQGFIQLADVEVFVLDEADRMLDMGFIRDIRRIMDMISRDCQILLFSATMPKEIVKLSDQFLKNPSRVSVDPPSSTVETIDSYVFFVEKKKKFDLLLHILKEEDLEKTLIFTRTKHMANKISRWLTKEGIKASAIHGNKSQSAREKALNGFRSGSTTVLVATDIAARGLDVLDITHIINYDMSNEPETYIHRIGRTARAGKSGVAYNFCAKDEHPYLRDIERLIKQHLIRKEDYPFRTNLKEPPITSLNSNKSRNNRSRRKR